MSRVRFIPHPADPPRALGDWPKRLQGDGFIIDLKLWDDLGYEAIYEDNFGKDYSMFDPSESEWWAEVRKD